MTKRAQISETEAKIRLRAYDDAEAGGRRRRLTRAELDRLYLLKVLDGLRQELELAERPSHLKPQDRSHWADA